MKVLHLNAYYIDNHLYSQLYSILDHDVEQKVYVPIKLDRKPENVINLKRTRLIFEKIIKPIHKFNYFDKIKRITKSVVSKKIPDDIDFIHAHNLFTDGAVAYGLKKKFGINYIVAIRGTDINLQYKYMWHRRFSIHRVLKQAEKIVFISVANKDKLFEMMPKNLVAKISRKVHVIPNGINDVWLNNMKKPVARSLGKTVRLLFVGQIKRQKNILLLIEAVKLLNETYDLDFILTIVGPEHINEPDFFASFLSLIKPLAWVDYKGKIKADKQLIEAYRSCDIFVMPSKNELFGLVYIEALSQGKPVLYSKGEGIDSYLKDYPAGQAVDPDNQFDIAEGIIEIVKNYKSYTDFDDVVLPFNWNDIASTYKQFYLNDE